MYIFIWLTQKHFVSLLCQDEVVIAATMMYITDGRLLRVRRNQGQANLFFIKKDLVISKTFLIFVLLN